MEILLLPLFIVGILYAGTVAVQRKYKTGKKVKYAVIANLCCFFSILIAAVVFPIGDFIALAADASTAVADNSKGLGYLAAALSTGLGSIGCGIAVGGAAPAAIGATAENSKAFAISLIFVALGEGIAIYGLLISFMILGRL